MTNISEVDPECRSACVGTMIALEDLGDRRARHDSTVVLLDDGPTPAT